MNTTLIISMGAVAIGTAVSQKVCEALGKTDMAAWIGLAGTSLVGITAVGLAMNLLNKAKEAIGG